MASNETIPMMLGRSAVPGYHLIDQNVGSGHLPQHGLVVRLILDQLELEASVPHC